MSLIASSDQDFQQHLKSNEKVIVKYYADWCGSCKLFAPKFKRLAADEKYKGYTFIDVNAELNPEARKFGKVKSLPTFAIFKDGTLQESVCTTNEEGVIDLIGKLK
jgi:thioredoxin 1